MSDNGEEFDKIPAGYSRPALSGGQPAHLSHPVRAGSRLSQIRFRRGGAHAERGELHDLHAAETLVAAERPNISGGGIALSIDLSGGATASSAIAASGIPA
jgi:dCTP deaminase